jgi:uncharacterized protein YndB with AHSA1/START domain
MVPEKIEREVTVAAPIERVWEVVTRSEHLGTWFGDAGAEIDLRPGGTMSMTFVKHGTVHAVVERVEPPHVFAYRWARPMGALPGEGNTTLVVFTLSSEGNETRLRVVESGFRELQGTEEEIAKHYQGNTDGWRIKTEDLRKYAERFAA